MNNNKINNNNLIKILLIIMIINMIILRIIIRIIIMWKCVKRLCRCEGYKWLREEMFSCFDGIDRG